MKNRTAITTVILVSMTLFVFTASCKQHETKTTSSAHITDAEKPSVDIHSAIVSNNIEAVKQHIKAGSDLNVKEPMSGSSPLITASTFNRVEIAKALINAKADITIKNNDGSTALHTAAFFGRIEIVQLLIDVKADKTVKNNFGATARETVIGDFDEVKQFYEMLSLQLQPMGFQLDLDEVKKARPIIALMLQ